MVTLRSLSSPADVEWLRVQRSRPELYRYFRQDKPITVVEQHRWWKSLDKNKARLFIVEDGDKKVGYSGFLPFNHYALSAEFGIFIIPEFQKKGYGKQALNALLKKGFEEYRLSTIYSDSLRYPNEKRWEWFQSFGFLPYAEACQGKRYKKQGVWVPSIKFYMTKDRYMEKNGQNGIGAVGAAVRAVTAALVQKTKGS